MDFSWDCISQVHSAATLGVLTRHIVLQKSASVKVRVISMALYDIGMVSASPHREYYSRFSLRRVGETNFIWEADRSPSQRLFPTGQGAYPYRPIKHWIRRSRPIRHKSHQPIKCKNHRPIRCRKQSSRPIGRNCLTVGRKHRINVHRHRSSPLSRLIREEMRQNSLKVRQNSLKVSSSSALQCFW